MNYLCVHGHFYQPPRENPWLEAVEAQESAEPFHDWNARITAECYAPNACSRILDARGRIERLVNNYEHISFNFGPTLLSWLEVHSPQTYAAVIEADRLGRGRFGGHGPALAQTYNHMILPLANDRDRRTQVRWGKADFQRRFGREPEGMWLAETAADLPTLTALADEGIKFTVLSPYQAARVRPSNAAEWTDVAGGKVDPTRSYRVELPGDKSIAVYFYNGPLSQAIAFEGLLSSGERFARRLLGAFRPEGETSEDQLVSVATDGETYGHHFAHGDMALAYALDFMEREGTARLTNYAEHLERAPPTWEAEIVGPSSWSCSHGVERWRADCGCKTGGRPEWNQAWRGPLRAALDQLRDRLAPEFESKLGELITDPWLARDEYIEIILERTPTRVDAFLARHARRPLAADEVTTALRWLEVQRNCMLMFTSCGWFFDELSGIETVQVIAYAARAVQLAGSLGLGEVESEFLTALALAKSNLAQQGDGRQIYQRLFKSMRVGLDKVAAHIALTTLVPEAIVPQSILRFDLPATDLRVLPAPNHPARLVVGHVTVGSRLTRASARYAVAAVHLGEFDLRGGVRLAGADDDERVWRVEVAFNRHDFAAVLQLLDEEYAAGRYSLQAVFRDERRKLLARLLNQQAHDLEAMFRRAVATHRDLMMLVTQLDTPLLPAYRNAASFVANLDLRRALDQDEPDLDALQRIAGEVELFGLALESGSANFSAQGAVSRVVAGLRDCTQLADRLKRCLKLLELLDALGVRPDLWAAQNNLYDLTHGEISHFAGDAAPLIARLGHRLHVKLG